MKKNIITLVALTLTLTINSFAFAGTRTPGVNKRQTNQQSRIAQGINSGQLTAKEAARMEANEAKIQEDKKLAKADGVVTKSERAQLRHEENRSSNRIFRAKHN